MGVALFATFPLHRRERRGRRRRKRRECSGCGCRKSEVEKPQAGVVAGVAISFSTSIADATAGRTIAVGTMIERVARPSRFVVVRPDRLGLYRLLEFDAHAHWLRDSWPAHL